MYVDVYWNSIRKQWAVIRVGKGNRKVTFYADELTIENATFHHGMRTRKEHVCKSRHVNAHRVVTGRLRSFRDNGKGIMGVVPATYDSPKEFKTSNTWATIRYARLVNFTRGGNRFATVG